MASQWTFSQPSYNVLNNATDGIQMAVTLSHPSGEQQLRELRVSNLTPEQVRDFIQNEIDKLDARDSAIITLTAAPISLLSDAELAIVADAKATVAANAQAQMNLAQKGQILSTYKALLDSGAVAADDPAYVAAINEAKASVTAVQTAQAQVAKPV